MDDLIETFGAPSGRHWAGIPVVSDVEGSPPSNPSLSAAYYAGWAQTLSSYSQQKAASRFTILPAVYASRDDTQTWQTLQQNVAPCHAIWIAAYGSNSPGLPGWDVSQTTPQGRSSRARFWHGSMPAIWDRIKVSTAISPIHPSPV